MSVTVGHRPLEGSREGGMLSPTDWAVLGLLAEGPAHGFAVAAALAPGGGLGRVWTLPRPVVYQAIERLLAARLVVALGMESSHAGPSRRILTVTPAGRKRLEAWLDEPVSHVRDVRSLLLIKLALLDRSGRSVRPLALRQLAVLQPALVALREEVREAEGFDRVLGSWRLSSHRAAKAFLETLAR